MPDASTVATVKDVPDDALTTGPANPVLTVPAPDSTPAVPQNAVPTQPSFLGGIIGDKYAFIQNFRTATEPLTRMNHEPLV